MAFLTPININGRAYESAYIKATLAKSSARQTVIFLEAWESQELRAAQVPSLPFPDNLVVVNDLQDLPNNNPVDYAYKLLEASGEFPEATWNI